MAVTKKKDKGGAPEGNKNAEKLTDKQERFCQEYLIDLNATQAAIRAGYSEKTANEQGSQLLVKLSIQNHISLLKAKRSDRTQITADRVIQELASIGFAKITDFLQVAEEDVVTNPLSDGQAAPDGYKEQKVKYKRVDIYETLKVNADAIPAISSIKQGKEGIELKLHDKVKSLELLGKHLGVFEEDNKQKTPKSIRIGFENDD